MEKNVGALTKRQAEVVRFTAFGYPQEEISKILGISQPRVSTALNTARKKIERAKATMDFYEEVNYLGDLKRAGFRGEVILKKE